jgi:hypothetical protein
MRLSCLPYVPHAPPPPLTLASSLYALIISAEDYRS